jgi:predicted DsbA family dithiol-disulfide isomerase
MELYFTEGADLTDREVLVNAAAAVGLDANDVRAALATDRDEAEIENEVQQAKDAGIQGVPFFILAGKYGISGAQDPTALAQAIRQVADEQPQASA